MLMQFFQDNLLWFCILISLVSFLLIEIIKNMGKFIKVAPAKVPFLQREPLLILDISKKSDFDAGHIAESINVPADSFSEEFTTLKANKDQPVLIVDQTGFTTSTVAKNLEALGFKNIHILSGGIAAWKGDNFPLTQK